MSDRVQVRPPALAGMFYPSERDTLALEVDAHLRAARVHAGPPVRAMIAPHAGYAFSGPVAGTAFRALEGRGDVRRVVVAGPSHRVAFRGLALSSAAAFRTPMGEVPVDTGAVRQLARLPGTLVFDEAHAGEHCIEVMLPFLQRVLGEFTLVPLVAGDGPPEGMAAAWRLFAGDARTLLLASSDLSHFHPYAEARRMDQATSRAIERLDGAAIGPDDACGRIPVQGLLRVAAEMGWSASTLDVRNSGDTAGGRDRVVGYGAYAFA